MMRFGMGACAVVALAFACHAPASAASAQAPQTAQAPESRCAAYDYKAATFSASYWMTSPNCRAIKHIADTDALTLEGNHASTDMFTAVFASDEGRSITQSVIVFKPKGWTIDAEKTLNDREQMTRGVLKALFPDAKGDTSSLADVHYTRIVRDGLPGAEFVATVTVDDRARVLVAYVIDDQPRNIAYYVVSIMDMPETSSTNWAFGYFDMAYRFLDSFHPAG